MSNELERVENRLKAWCDETKEMLRKARSPEGAKEYANTLDTLKNVFQIIEQERDQEPERKRNTKFEL